MPLAAPAQHATGRTSTACASIACCLLTGYSTTGKLSASMYKPAAGQLHASNRPATLSKHARWLQPLASCTLIHQLHFQSKLPAAFCRELQVHACMQATPVVPVAHAGVPMVVANSSLPTPAP
eukprot:209076-Chlamydomonas_euryale.AAC.2